jgi:hypothetical protein
MFYSQKEKISKNPSLLFSVLHMYIKGKENSEGACETWLSLGE